MLKTLYSTQWLTEWQFKVLLTGGKIIFFATFINVPDGAIEPTTCTRTNYSVVTLVKSTLRTLLNNNKCVLLQT